MRKDGRGHGDHDDEPAPIGSSIFAAAVIVVVSWLMAGRPTFGLW